jgi:hypothetical protein
VNLADVGSKHEAELMIMDLWREMNWYGVQSKRYQRCLKLIVDKPHLAVLVPNIEAHATVSERSGNCRRPVYIGSFLRGSDRACWTIQRRS